MLESIAVAQGMQMHNLCMSGTVPLLGVPGGAWERTLEGVKRVHPDVLVYEMAWPKQPNLSQMLADSVAALAPYTKRIVLVAQYPV